MTKKKSTSLEVASFKPPPMTPAAQSLIDRITPKIQSRLEEVDRIPVSVLIWGPGITSTSPMTVVRTELRNNLRLKGHAAVFSEDLVDPLSSHSLRLQQLAQAHEFDMVVSLPCTPGSIGEVHDFAADRRIMGRMLVFLNQMHLNGYSSQSLETISTIFSCQIAYYPDENDTYCIQERALEEVQKVRELKYLLQGRH